MAEMTTMMEFEFPYSTVTVPIFFLTFLFLIVKLLKNQSVNSLNLIPGPKKLPLIGNLHLFVRSPLIHRTFRDLATKYGPLMHLRLGEVPFVIVSSVDVADKVLKIHDTTFANRPPMVSQKLTTYNYTDIATAPYGEYWRHLRKICTVELLSARRVQSFQRVREEENMDAARRIGSKAGSEVNLSDVVYKLSFDITTRAAIGKKTEEEEDDDRESVTSALKKIVELCSGMSIADLYPSYKFLPLVTGFEMAKAFRRLDRQFDIVIDQHRSAGRDATERSEDLADVLLKYQGPEQGLTIDNIKAVLMDVFAAGVDTSGNVVEWAMAEMMMNPGILKRAQEEVRRVFDGKGKYVNEAEFHELTYLRLVIKETMRLHPPLPFLIPRYNTQKCEINGYEIPPKTKVMVNVWALGRDSNYWDDPDKFMPERFLNSSIDYRGNNLEYIPFGAGRRKCPGISFGIANVESVLAMLLYHFDWEMPNGIKNEELDMTEAFGLTVTRKHKLHLIPTVMRPLELPA